MSPKAKASVPAGAAARGLSVGEYVRRRVEDEDEFTPEQEAELAALVDEVNAGGSENGGIARSDGLNDSRDQEGGRSIVARGRRSLTAALGDALRHEG